MSKWIWNFGDFEIYHSALVHDRRVGYGANIPAMWKLYRPEPNVRFEKTVTLAEPGSFRVFARGKGQVVVYANSERYSLENKKYAIGEEIPLSAGSHRVQIQLCNLESFPCAFVEGCIESDESWLCDDVTGDWRPVGSWDLFDDPGRSPEIFPFAYEPAEWVKKEPVEGGVLYDFGKELFCRLEITGLSGRTQLRFGESGEEAMDPEYCVVRCTLEPEDGRAQVEPVGFRYVFLSDPGAQLRAEFEYLPLENRGSFSCGEEIVDWVWDTAAYTLWLNCREFFFDGIKRDRWVWSADAYQTQFVNHYSFFDPEIEKRTLIALGGKRPFVQHVNTIVDYTFFWIMGIWEYYKAYGDRKFLEQMLPQMEEVMDFVGARRDRDGLLRGGENDWVFIDWADCIDKEGAVLGEQILLAQALDNYGRMLEALGLPGEAYLADAEKLQALIREKYWDGEKGAFIDSFESGKRNVSRHCNLWAYLYLPCTDEQKAGIYENVVCNEAVPAITTPYFKFYENQVHCEAGDPGHLLEDSIRHYYGPMKALGATALFEQFDPTQSGVEHYAMYNLPFDKSLCHAWSSSPIYLIGAYRLGVQNTGIAYDSFRVKPMLGDLPPFEGTVPLPGGQVKVSVSREKVSVLSTVPGGVLVVGEKIVPIAAGKILEVEV